MNDAISAGNVEGIYELLTNISCTNTSFRLLLQHMLVGIDETEIFHTVAS